MCALRMRFVLRNIGPNLFSYIFFSGSRIEYIYCGVCTVYTNHATESNSHNQMFIRVHVCVVIYIYKQSTYSQICSTRYNPLSHTQAHSATGNGPLIALCRTSHNKPIQLNRQYTHTRIHRYVCMRPAQLEYVVSGEFEMRRCLSCMWHETNV